MINSDNDVNITYSVSCKEDKNINNKNITDSTNKQNNDSYSEQSEESEIVSTTGP